jgi:hypothetical protein
MPVSRLACAPFIRYWEENSVAAITANANIVAMFRYGRFERFLISNLRKWNFLVVFISLPLPKQISSCRYSCKSLLSVQMDMMIAENRRRFSFYCFPTLTIPIDNH